MKKTVPLTFYVNGERKIIGEAVVEVDGGGHLSVKAQLDEQHRDIIYFNANDMSSVSMHKQPCYDGNTNICVAEGCFGESCLKIKE